MEGHLSCTAQHFGNVLSHQLRGFDVLGIGLRWLKTLFLIPNGSLLRQVVHQVIVWVLPLLFNDLLDFVVCHEAYKISTMFSKKMCALTAFGLVCSRLLVLKSHALRDHVSLCLG